MSVAAPEPAPPRKRRSREKPLGEVCLNCKAGIETHYCPHCGQHNAPPDLTLHAVLHEFFAEILYYDSKMWRTVRTLVANPGRLSGEWSAGRRIRFLSPVRLYLTVTFLFFLSTTLHKTKGVHLDTGLQTSDRQKMMRQLASSELSPVMRQAAQQQEAQLHLSLEDDEKYQAALNQGSKNYEEAVRNGSLKGRSGWFGHQIDKLVAKSINDPSGLTDLYISEIPKVLFVILPLLALALKLIYWRQKRTFVEHLVFLLHFHSFAFLVLLPVALISAPWMDVFAGLTIALWIPGYAFVAMIRFYRQPWWLTLLKSWMLGFIYVLLSAVGALLALVFVVASLKDSQADAKPNAPAVQAAPKPINLPGASTPLAH